MLLSLRSAMTAAFAPSGGVALRRGGAAVGAAKRALPPPTRARPSPRAVRVISAAEKEPQKSNGASSPTNPLGRLVRVETNGDVVRVSLIALLAPLLLYKLLTSVGVPSERAGSTTTIIVLTSGTLAWVGSYIFRVANKKMTYATQLRDYENRVIEKRYEELSDEELSALAEEIESEERS